MDIDNFLGGGKLKSMSNLKSTKQILRRFVANLHITTKYHSGVHGFTIVELLIVIVVIAILAVISIATYTNIQQRAKNAAIINAATQSLKTIQTYIAITGEYPLKSTGAVRACVTSTSGCHDGVAGIVSANTTFDAKIATVGTLPKSVPADSSENYGVTYLYYVAINFNGSSQPATLNYYLYGKNQQCGLPGVIQGGWNVSITSTTGYTSTTGDKTTCYISIPGPENS